MKNNALLIMAVFAVFTLLTAAGVLAQTAAPQVITTDAAPAQAAPQTAPAAAPAQAPAAQTPAPANTAVRTAKPAAVRQGYAYGYPYGYAPQQSYYNARGNRPVSFQEYFGFDGIPFNGSHIQAFRRYHGRGF